MEFTAKQIAQIIKGTVDGDESAIVTKFSKIEHGKPGSLCFFANPKYEQYVYTSKASVIIVNNDFVPKEKTNVTFIRVQDAYTAIAELLNYVSHKKRKTGRHRSLFARWYRTTKFGKGVYVGAFAYVGHRTEVGDGSIIYEHVYIIGDNVILHANCVIGSDGFGNAPQPDGTWEKIEHLGNVIIGNNVEIGANTTVDRAQMESTIIGNGVKIDNLCQIAHNVIIGDNTVMAAMCGIAGSTVIGKNCIFAGQVGIAGHLKVADNTVLGAQAGLIGNVRKSGEVLMGTPAIAHKQYLRAYAKFKQSGAE